MGETAPEADFKSSQPIYAETADIPCVTGQVYSH